MPKCPHCLELFIGHPRMCPVCSAPLKESGWDQEPERWDGLTEEAPESVMVRVARFVQAAEAGYFANELISQEAISAVVNIDEHFDALSGIWSTMYVVLVPQQEAERAALAMQSMLELQGEDELSFREDNRKSEFVSDDDEKHYRDVISFDGSHPARSSVNWGPIVLTLAAGSIVFWGFRTLQNRPQPRANLEPMGVGQQDLWDRLSGSGEPWVQERDSGEGTRRIQFETDGDWAVIHEDNDGDGIFEKKHRWRRKSLVR